MTPADPAATAPRLTRERIVATALALIDRDGLGAVTMRRIADELGVQAPSLYNHMRSKDALLDAVAESVMQQVDASAFDRLDWRAALDAWAWSYYEALVAHPNLVPHLAVSFGRLDVALARADQVYAGLRRAGWTPSRATRISAAVRYAVYGAALGSFAGGFGANAARYPNLHDIERLREQPDRVDRAALKLLIDRFLDGLDTIAPAAGPRGR
ncbi:TetR/AcrR family transcriptional regulator [Conexibacter woesei]|uniref:Transcriptional regulator, TetR family n=1 Tax=Conexibacter woesei (strain DSM 14684 / CCUG 47730 / CIP 108061 / JCM 11494 / NBRC 100937 / ID131577) TaxID=469383 RepID=D3F773_CONWI|nr:TetR/AcrR family transcriptional regulator [Conexibacter woesei]ADB48844.1 transcriptional regulator, TetR family [Conexibacter woesei DSM 14684]